MLNFKLTKSLCLTAAMAFSVGASAQTVLWGTGSGNTAIDSIGQFASTDGTLSSLGWSTTGSGPSGACNWEWSADGALSGSFSTGAGEVIDGSVASVANGCAVFDSDLWGYGPVGGSGAGSAGVPQNVTLTSPYIDMSGNQDSIIAVRFYSAHRDFNSTAWTVDMSTDDGATWTNSGDVRFASAEQYNGWVELNFGQLFLGLTDADIDSCLLRFNFDGDAYNWTVDDVSIVTGKEYDLTFGASTQDFGYIQGYNPMDFEKIPLSQITAAGATTAARQYYAWGVLAGNNGGKDILGSDNPKVIYDVQYDDNGTWVSQAMDSMMFTNGILAGDTATLNGVNINNQINSLPLTGFQPSQAGNYRIVYTLVSDVADEDPTNNELIREFEITADTWYSTTTIDAAGDLVSDRNIGPINITGADDAVEFESGNVYYFPAGSGWYLDSVKYLVQAGTAFDGNYNGSTFNVGVRIYEWNASTDGNTDGEADFDEYVFQSQYVDTINVVGAGIYQRTVRVPDPLTINPATGAFDHPYILGDDRLYYVSVYQSVALQDGNLLGGDGDLVINGSANNCFSVRTNTVNHQGFSTFGYGTTATALLANGGFTLGTGVGEMQTGFANVHSFSPTVALKLTDTAPTVSVDKTAQVEGNFEVFPNPASSVVTTKVDLDEMSSSVRYIVTDATGRVLAMETRKDVQNDVYTLDVEKFATGVYFVHIKTDNGSISKRFVKQ